MSSNRSIDRDFMQKLFRAARAVNGILTYGTPPNEQMPGYLPTSDLADEVQERLSGLRACHHYQHPEELQGGIRVHFRVLREAGEQIYAGISGDLPLIPQRILLRFLDAGTAIVKQVTGRRYQAPAEPNSEEADSDEKAETDEQDAGPPSQAIPPRADRPGDSSPSITVRRAKESYQWVCNERPDLVPKLPKRYAREQWQYIRENSCPAYKDDDGDDLTVPGFETWKRYLRKGAADPANPKSTPRANRPHGKSIVRRDQI